MKKTVMAGIVLMTGFALLLGGCSSKADEFKLLNSDMKRAFLGYWNAKVLSYDRDTCAKFKPLYEQELRALDNLEEKFVTLQNFLKANPEFSDQLGKDASWDYGDVMKRSPDFWRALSKKNLEEHKLDVLTYFSTQKSPCTCEFK